MKYEQIKDLFYITHLDNLPSILKMGILSHARIEEAGIEFTPIYDEDIISIRKGKEVPGGESLWSFANLYFNPRNPMLYRVVCEKSIKNLAVVSIKPHDIFNRKDGNIF